MPVHVTRKFTKDVEILKGKNIAKNRQPTTVVLDDDSDGEKVVLKKKSNNKSNKITPKNSNHNIKKQSKQNPQKTQTQKNSKSDKITNTKTITNKKITKINLQQESLFKAQTFKGTWHSTFAGGCVMVVSKGCKVYQDKLYGHEIGQLVESEDTRKWSLGDFELMSAKSNFDKLVWKSAIGAGKDKVVTWTRIENNSKNSDEKSIQKLTNVKPSKIATTSLSTSSTSSSKLLLSVKKDDKLKTKLVKKIHTPSRGGSGSGATSSKEILEIDENNDEEEIVGELPLLSKYNSAAFAPDFKPAKMCGRQMECKKIKDFVEKIRTCNDTFDNISVFSFKVSRS